jgi:site-specific DNA-methyltransferase (adenine-specific)
MGRIREGALMDNRIIVGDCLETLKTLPDQIAQCCVTSPPYWGLRDYGNDAQIGLEETPEEYVNNLVLVFRELRRVLCDDGVLWLNLGDSYSSGGSCGDPGSASTLGHDSKGGGPYLADLGSSKPRRDLSLKPKNLVGIPWRVALALQADGWYLRSDVIWHKPNPMPESVTDRPTKAHEYVFLLTKSARYYYDADSIRGNAAVRASGGSFTGKQGGARSTAVSGGVGSPDRNYKTRNKRSVWTVTARPFSGAHFAVMPPALVKPCVLAGSRPGDLVIDPFMGAGTVAMVAHRLDRRWLGCELSEEYATIARERLEPLTSQQRLFAADHAALRSNGHLDTHGPDS